MHISLDNASTLNLQRMGSLHLLMKTPSFALLFKEPDSIDSAAIDMHETVIEKARDYSHIRAQIYLHTRIQTATVAIVIQHHINAEVATIATIGQKASHDITQALFDFIKCLN